MPVAVHVPEIEDFLIEPRDREPDLDRRVGLEFPRGFQFPDRLGELGDVDLGAVEVRVQNRVPIGQKRFIKRRLFPVYRKVKEEERVETGLVSRRVGLVFHEQALEVLGVRQFFTTRGRVFRLKGYEIPEFSRQSKGIPLVNLLNLDKEEKVTSILKLNRDEDIKYLVFATRDGLIKRTAIEEFDKIRANGKKAINLKDNDELIAVHKTNGLNEILMASTNGRMVRFTEDCVRVMGRSASGVKGIDLIGGKLVNMDVVKDNCDVFVITKNGYGKKTPIDEYRITNRGGKGVKTLNITDKNGDIVSFNVVSGDNKDLMIVTDEGIVIRIDMSQISTLSRVTQGVRLINLRDGQFVSTVAIIEKDDSTDSSDNISTEDIVENSNNSDIVDSNTL